MHIQEHLPQNRHEPKLKVSDEYCRMLLDGIRGIAILLLDVDGIVSTWNPGAQSILEYAADEVMGQHCACFYAEEDIQIQKPEAELQKAVSDGHFEVEDWRARKNGSRFWASILITPLYNRQTKHIGFSMVIRDLSKRKQAQDALAQTLKDLSDIKFALDESAIVSMTDHNGIITDVNDTFCKISQYSREELIGQSHRIVNSGYHSRAFFTELWKVISQGKVWKGEIQNRSKDGTLYWIDTTIVPFVDETGKPYQYASIRNEITGRKRVEVEIRQLNEEMEQRIQTRTAELEEANRKLSETLAQLQESEKLRNTFISALTHDLRTPLVAQERALDLFLGSRDKLPPRLGELAERLSKSNQGLLAMVNMLLEAYQYESGKIDLLWEPIHMQALVADCFAEVSALADTKQICLLNEIPSDFPCIPGDSQQIKRVMMNLIGNALENIPAGSHIRIRGIHSHPEEVIVEVEDNGPGIPPEVLPHLFQRYHIGDHTRRKKIGTGLGLYICRMIMEQHQGAIRVESRPDSGTRFFLTFSRQPFEESIDEYKPD